MLSPATLRLVLLVSAAHALVHVYELSLPSVEQEIAGDYFPQDAASGKRTTGLLSTCWRLPWGMGALLAGWLVDRYGARRMLVIYLFGCSLMCGIAAVQLPLPSLFLIMFLMGTFACIYHPAGLALISHETSVENRPRALGIHGIFGSAGIATAPFVVGLVLQAGFGWRQYFWLLALPGLLLGSYFALQRGKQASALPSMHPDAQQDRGDWVSFFTLTLVAVMQGIIYAGVMSFLKRYVTASPDSATLGQLTTSSYVTSGILLAGCLGQYVSGRIARPELLELQMIGITFANAPFLLWMALASGGDRVLAAGLFSVVHFMHQPIYNSLIAKYTPRRRRSLCYGFSFAMGFGVGSAGSAFVGYSTTALTAYSTLSLVAIASAVVAAMLWSRNRAKRHNPC